MKPKAPSSTAHLPLWARGADAFALAAAAVAVFVLLFGRLVTGLGPIRITISTPARPALVALLVVALRHRFWRSPSLRSRMTAAVARWRASSAVTAVLPAAASSRAAVLFAGYMAVLTIGYPGPLPFRLSANEFVNLPARWDTGWYLGIATLGYRYHPVDRQQNIAFFPAYPMLTRVAGRLLGGREDLIATHVRFLWVAVGISLVSFYWGLLYVWRLARAQIGAELAGVAILFLATYPFSLFFSTAYTESLFLLTAAAAIFHFARGELLPAGAWGLLVGLTRPNGVFVGAALGLIAIARTWPSMSWAGIRWPESEVKRQPAFLPMLAAALMPAVGVLLYSAFIYSLSGRPFAWAEVQEAWGRTYRGVEAVVLEPYEYIEDHGLYEYTKALPMDVLNGTALALAAAACWPIARRLGVAYVAFIVLSLAPPLLKGGVLSMGRFTSVLFPIFLYLALAVPARYRAPLIIVFAVLQGFGAVVFFTWRPMT